MLVHRVVMIDGGIVIEHGPCCCPFGGVGESGHTFYHQTHPQTLAAHEYFTMTRRFTVPEIVDRARVPMQQHS